MLFIWDLHFKSDKKNDIFKKLNEIIEKVDDENIIFLGDYIYHFAYNPKILWEFFDYCLILSKTKKVFILAGNHDYIKWHFVFSEVEKILDKNSNLQIISKPKIFEIESKKVLFFPYFTEIASEEEFIQTDKKLKSLKHPALNTLQNIFVEAYKNWKQDDKNLKISGTINLKLINYILEYNPDILVHHFYTVNTTFPGQFARFKFQDIALSDKIFNLNLEIISWHLHQAFKYKNYTCVGSFWNTSPLEENDTKVVFQYPDKFYQVVINPYISIELENTEEKINENLIQEKWHKIINNMETKLNNPINLDNFNLKNINLVVKAKKFKKFEDILDNKLIHQINSISYRQKKEKINKILSDIEVNQEKLATSINSWKELAKTYISKKYPNEKDSYFEILKDLNLI